MGTPSAHQIAVSRPRRLLLLAVALVCGCVPALTNPAPIAAVAVDPAARDLACSLADEVGPRLAGSEGDARAVAWAVAKMKALGLQNVRTEPVKVPHWVRGEASGELSGTIRRRLTLTALGGSVGTPPEGLEAEVVSVPSIEALRALPRARVEGRIVFFDKVMPRVQTGKGYEQTVDVRSRGAGEAAKLGAVASVIRSVGTSESRFPHTGGMRYPEGGPKIPAAALAIPDAEVLRRALARGDGPVRLKLTSSARQLEDADSANVIGEVVGTTKPDEVFLLAAHLDSWDLGDGAVDDAAGVGVVLDVAQRLLKQPLSRTVRVVLFANEENGLKGAKAYAAAHQAELLRHVAAMEVDTGAGRALSVGYAGGAAALAAMASLAQSLGPLGVALEADEDTGGADSSQLDGVPQVAISQDCSRYFDLHHTADDTCDKIHADELSQVSAVALAVTRHVAGGQVDLGRRPPPKP